MKTPRLEVFRGKRRWYWHLQSRNGQIQCPSEGYATKAGAVRGAKAAQRAMAIATVVVL